MPHSIRWEASKANVNAIAEIENRFVSFFCRHTYFFETSKLFSILLNIIHNGEEERKLVAFL